MNTFNWNDADWLPQMNYGRFNVETPWMWFDADQVWESEDELWLYIEKNTKTIEVKGKTYKPSIACGTVFSEQTYGYGTFSADIALPRGRNLWPSFWLVGEGKWPNNGEIDIMEGYSNSNGSYYKFPLSWRTTNNVHWFSDYQEYWNYDGHKMAGAENVSLLKQMKNPADNFVNYAVEWKPNKVSFKVNGKVTRVIEGASVASFNGSKVHAVFDLWTTGLDFSLDLPMKIKNFKYLPL